MLKLESDLTQLKLQRAHQDAAIKARERDVERLSKTVEGLKAELHEANAKWVICVLGGESICV